MNPFKYVKNLFFGQQTESATCFCRDVPSSCNTRLYVNEELFSCHVVRFFPRNGCGGGELTILVSNNEYQKLLNKKAKLTLISDLDNKSVILYDARVKFDPNESLAVSVDDLVFYAHIGFSVLERTLNVTEKLDSKDEP